MLVGKLRRAGDVLAAKLVCQLRERRLARLVERRANRHRGLGVLQLLSTRQHVLHDVGCGRSPCSVFDERDGAVLEIALDKLMMYLAMLSSFPKRSADIASVITEYSS